MYENEELIEEEVPEWVNAYKEEKPKEVVNYGRGNRVKKNVIYNDDILSDD